MPASRCARMCLWKKCSTRLVPQRTSLEQDQQEIAICGCFFEAKSAPEVDRIVGTKVIRNGPNPRTQAVLNPCPFGSKILVSLLQLWFQFLGRNRFRFLEPKSMPPLHKMVPFFWNQNRGSWLPTGRGRQNCPKCIKTYTKCILVPVVGPCLVPFFGNQIGSRKTEPVCALWHRFWFQFRGPIWYPKLEPLSCNLGLFWLHCGDPVLLPTLDAKWEPRAPSLEQTLEVSWPSQSQLLYGRS